MGVKAADCGVCHQALYEEWRTSVHAHAWTDRQFQGELAKDPEVGWVCLNCHTPAADQQPERVTATGAIRAPQRTPNPTFNAAWQEEGISCATCHVRDGEILGPYGDTAAPHPVRKATEALRSEDLCLSCHQAVARYEDALVCAFNTGVEWQEAEVGKPCQGCHMPTVQRPLVPGYPEREVRRHLWLGSRVPKDALEPGEQAFYDLFEPGLDVALDLPEAAAPGQLVEGTLTVTNARAGHRVPTGDPERYVLVTVTVTDPGGAQLARTTLRLGQRWVWWPEAQRLADDRLAPGESRAVTVRFPMPEGGAAAHLLAEHYRISPENAAYHGLDGYPIKSTTAEARYEVAATGGGG
ncbi:MAG: hypothetical protein H6739_30540 [Alphaproteobacteria bacterium]|nr:hypothetical protein [Alphaproteobacteria bacterium]